MAQMTHRSLWCMVACFISLGGCVHDAGKDHVTETRPDDFTGDSVLLGHDADSQALRIQALKAYKAGLAAAMQEPISNVGDAWLLQEINRLAPDQALQHRINNTVESNMLDPFLKLIDPCAPCVELAAKPGDGLNRFYNYMLAPFGTPREQALSLIHDFVAINSSGYILTHQFLLLQWAEQIGFELPENLVIKKQDFLERILQEQLKNLSFSDLYTERAAILLHFGNQDPSNAANWVQTIVDAQLEDGNWGIYFETITFDGESISGELGVSHINALALLSLRTYLDRY
ncbi:MAG: hypothetical protein K9N55_07020 [Phycisphaerae bacterium]|nr:hypothetical protein [Phycisphaerae bacterium]